MSWSFEYHGKNKDAMKDVCAAALRQSVGHSGEAGKKAIDPVVNLLDMAIDIAVLPKTADYFCVKSNGHADWVTSPPEQSGPGQCYFSFEIRPVYLPKLVG